MKTGSELRWGFPCSRPQGEKEQWDPLNFERRRRVHPQYTFRLAKSRVLPNSELEGEVCIEISDFWSDSTTNWAEMLG
jgi:hypothetical protein